MKKAHQRGETSLKAPNIGNQSRFSGAEPLHIGIIMKPVLLELLEAGSYPPIRPSPDSRDLSLPCASRRKYRSLLQKQPKEKNKNPQSSPLCSVNGHFRLGRAADLGTEQPTVAGDMVNKSVSGDLLRKWHAGDNIHALPAFNVGRCTGTSLCNVKSRCCDTPGGTKLCLWSPFSCIIILLQKC